ncbi:MAG: FAD-binding oxidoreductase, partial [Pyrinomonadaceae bacterium]|nr:FAD-binding oxidoreductase [Pyrinomonadaceae bacterium]
VISAPVFVNAAGLGASKFSPELRISPKKGHLVITDRYEGLIGHQIAELGYAASAHSATGESVAFNIQPRITGQVLIGSSRQPGVSSTDTDRRIVGKMIDRAAQYMPALSDLKATRVWTGVRPATRDNIPYIGRSTTNKHVVVAAGHEGLGITTATGTAEIVTDMILGRASKIPVEPYSVERDAGT